MADDRSYPARPILAVSGAIIRDGAVLLVQRARPPASGLYSLPGGVVETGETLEAALIREVREETALEISVIGFAAISEVIAHDRDGLVDRHFVVLAYAARWISGEPLLNDELSAWRWVKPGGISDLETTANLDGIVRAAFRLDAERGR